MVPYQGSVPCMVVVLVSEPADLVGDLGDGEPVVETLDDAVDGRGTHGGDGRRNGFGGSD